MRKVPLKQNTQARSKSWKEKLNREAFYKVKKTEKEFADIPANSKMLIATPKIVDAYVRQIPRGSQSTIQTMRKDLALAYQADYTCPVTSGIFLRIVAEASYEEFVGGKPLSSVTPFWRMGDSSSSLARKVSCGAEFIKKQREKEGLDP